jgi:hypothetical protein
MKSSNKDPEIAAMEAYDPSEDEHKEMMHTINSLVQDVTELQDKLAVYQMTEFNSSQKEAAETIKDLREKLRVNEIVLDSLTRGRNGYMNRVAEAVRSAKYWHKRCLKAEKNNGVTK